ncbi:hypothetical protein T4E_9657 [Trichinella pseudospiralis]|uniref:Uncharacterized protein n=1 Tax=Trichinella pseudospiralis TaxID=6337 RepID=A0A0V0YKT7_TRIPS|nr:hypothetical protein T4E_9657 [Trichinella pseudospiralis]
MKILCGVRCGGRKVSWIKEKAAVVVISSSVFALDCLINARQKGREKLRPIPARRQIARDAPTLWEKKRTSLLEAAARCT